MFTVQIREDVRLALLEERYAEEAFAVLDAGRARLRQWLPFVDATTTCEHTKEYIRKSLAQFARNEGFVTGIWYRNRFAGTIGYLPIDWTHRKVEIGYWLSAEAEGHGIVTAAARVLLEHAFSVLRLNRVEIRCVKENRRSAQVAERLGFQLDGIHRQAYMLHGTPRDLCVYSLLSHEWNPALKRD